MPIRGFSSALLVGFSAVLLLCGCATSMTQLTTAKAAKPLKGQVTVNYSLPLHTNLFEAAWDTAKSIEKELDQNEQLTEQDARKLFESALQYALFLSGGAPEIIGRLGVTDALLEGVDVGVRYNGNLIKGDVKLQIWESENGSGALAVDVGYGYQFSVVSNLLQYVALTDWTRHDLDCSVIYSVEPNNIFKGWIAPRAIWSRIDAEPKIDSFLTDRLPESLKQYTPSQYFQDESMLYFGATAGMMVGYKYAYIGLELSVFRLLFKPTILEQKKDFDGVVFAPAVGATVVW